MIAAARLFRLEPWVVRAIVPPHRHGVYLLYAAGRPVYAGRSDRDLQARLVTHALAERAEFFDYLVTATSHGAFDLECALFHALGPHLENLIHPASQADTRQVCVVCDRDEILAARLAAREGDAIMVATTGSVAPLFVVSTAHIPSVETDHLTVSAS